MRVVRLTDKNKCDRMEYMISYETFSQYLLNGQLKTMHFMFGPKEYVIAREEIDDTPYFVFATEEQEAIRYPSVKALLKYAIIGGHSLREVWNHIVPICNDSLFDNDYLLVQYGDSLGRVVCSAEGTATAHERYATMHLLPSLASVVVVIALLLICTLFISDLSWTFFAVASAVVAGAFIIAQFIFFSNTRKYRYGNPRAYLYLLSDGAVIVTTRYEHAIPYSKIIRLDTEAGISMVTMKTVFYFTADNGKEITDTLTSIVNELHAAKRRRNKKAN